MEELRTLNSLVIQARQRMVGNLLLEQAMVGAAASLGGAMLLLLVGSEILNWYWLVVLFVGGAGLGAWRALRRLPSPYVAAQQLDHRLGLHDSLSTAYYFAQPETSRPASPAVVSAQRQQAEQAAGTASAAAGVPWRLPRQFYWMAAMAMGVVSLGVVRYGVHGSLDLTQPMVAAVVDFFRMSAEPVAAKSNKARPASQVEAAEPGEFDTGTEDPTPLREPASSQMYDPFFDQDSGLLEMADVDWEELMREMSGPSLAPAKDGSKSGPGFDDTAGNQEQQSLLNKLIDGFANLVSTVSLFANEGKQVGNKQAAQKAGEKGEAQASAKGEPGAKGEPDPNASPGEQPGSGELRQMEGEGNPANGQAGEVTMQADGDSGAGKQEGSKQVRLAEQLEAMGKLSEIFGQRAMNVTGEMMVEVSGDKNQDLRTAYSQRGAAHREAGGDIHRDEIPLQFQQYVQQYFEQVRKGEDDGAAGQDGARK